MVSISKSIKLILKWLQKLKQRLGIYKENSILANSFKEIKNDFYSLPLNKIGVILTTAILTNTILEIISLNFINMRPIEVLVRLFFLFLGTAGLSCKAAWKDIKDSSIIFRRD